MHNRNWEICSDSTLCNIYDEVWSYISLNYDVDNCPLFYLNKSKSIHNLGLFALDDRRRPIVVLNKEFINYPKEAVNTIIHELTHYLAWELNGHRNQNHNERWKKLANSVGKHFGEKITTYCEEDHPVINSCRVKKSSKVKTINYNVTCNTCSRDFTYLTKSGIVKYLLIDPHYSKGICPYCKGNYFTLNIKTIG